MEIVISTITVFMILVSAGPAAGLGLVLLAAFSLESEKARKALAVPPVIVSEAVGVETAAKALPEEHIVLPVSPVKEKVRKPSAFTVKRMIAVEIVSAVVIVWIDRAYSIFPGILEMVVVFLVCRRLNPEVELYDEPRHEGATF